MPGRRVSGRTIALPAGGTCIALVASPSRGPRMDKPTRILVVDDEAAPRKFLVKELSARGFAVEAAASGEEALRKTAEAVYDVVLLDMKMPGMDGLAALREIRRVEP